MLQMQRRRRNEQLSYLQRRRPRFDSRHQQKQHGAMFRWIFLPLGISWLVSRKYRLARKLGDHLHVGEKIQAVPSLGEVL